MNTKGCARKLSWSKLRYCPRIVNVTVEIRIEHFPDTSHEHYHLSQFYRLYSRNVAGWQQPFVLPCCVDEMWMELLQNVVWCQWCYQRFYHHVDGTTSELCLVSVVLSLCFYHHVDGTTSELCLVSVVLSLCFCHHRIRLLTASHTHSMCMYHI
jgi:hypothetical protein